MSGGAGADVKRLDPRGGGQGRFRVGLRSGAEGRGPPRVPDKARMSGGALEGYRRVLAGLSQGVGESVAHIARRALLYLRVPGACRRVERFDRGYDPALGGLSIRMAGAVAAALQALTIRNISTCS
jgi:hypothetical protein